MSSNKPVFIATPFTFSPDVPENSPSNRRRFSGVAYAGGVIRDHGGWPNGVVFDLASTKLPEQPLPLLFQHDHSEPIGVIEQVNADGGKLSIAGYLLDNPKAQRIAESADQGFPWQLSVGIYPTDILTLNETKQLNGHDVQGGVAVFVGNRLREVSIVTLGADDQTSASIFSHLPTQQEPSMDLSQATAKIEQLEAENSKLKQDIEQFAAAQKAAHESRVREFFKAVNVEFTAEHAAPWLAMNDEQFSAASGLIRTTHSQHPNDPRLFTHQATSGSAGPSTADIDSAAIFAARRQGAAGQK